MFGSEFDLQLRAALVGDLDREMAKGLRRVEASLQWAVFGAGEDLQSKWRQDVAQSGLQRADQMVRTIRLRRYRNTGLNPAALVYSSLPLLQAAFERGVTIRSKEGLFLAIPNPAVWPAGRIRRTGGRGAHAVRQSSIAVAEARFGPLRFVYRRGKASLLVAEVRASSTQSGRFRRASATALRTGRGLQTVVVFFLVPQARLPRMLRGDVIRARFERDADRLVERRYIDRMNSPDGPALLGPPAEG